MRRNKELAGWPMEVPGLQLATEPVRAIVPGLQLATEPVRAIVEQTLHWTLIGPSLEGRGGRGIMAE